MGGATVCGGGGGGGWGGQFIHPRISFVIFLSDHKAVIIHLGGCEL